jgi:hypothetical protein
MSYYVNVSGLNFQRGLIWVQILLIDLFLIGVDSAFCRILIIAVDLIHIWGQ